MENHALDLNRSSGGASASMEWLYGEEDTGGEF